MKEFKKPVMAVVKLGPEEIIRASVSCFEIFACQDCYCTEVTCDPRYDCTGLVCPSLSDFD